MFVDVYKNCWTSGKQYKPWSDAVFSSRSTLFAQACLFQIFGQIGNCSLSFLDVIVHSFE